MKGSSTRSGTAWTGGPSGRWWKPALRLGWPQQQRLGGGAQPPGVDGAGQVEGADGGVDVGALGVVRGVEGHALLERGGGPDVHQGGGGVEFAEPVQLLLTEGDQREVGGGVPAGVRPFGVLGEGAQCGEPRLGERADPLLVEQFAGPGPLGDEQRALRGVDGGGVQAQDPAESEARGGALGHRLGPGEDVLGGDALGLEAAQVVELDLRFGVAREQLGGGRIEVAQQAVADAVVRYGAQLLLHPAEGAAEFGAGGGDLGPGQRPGGPAVRGRGR